MATLGADWDAQRFGWDNEFPAEEIAVDRFEIASLPVTIAQYRRFVDDGGYQRETLWDPEAWAWRHREGMTAPVGWMLGDGGGACRWLFGERDLDALGAWPVQVSHAEATAYARWAGARLPTEAELHRAAYGHPEGQPRRYPWGDATPGPEHGNFDFARLHPTAVGSSPAGVSAWGVQELVGNGWEWTSTPFLPRPGFRAWMPHYPGYSADFFDGRHLVVFGGSWATAAGLLRRSFRNWYQGNYPYVFGAFRLVW